MSNSPDRRVMRLPGVSARAMSVIRKLMDTLPPGMKADGYIATVGWELGCDEPDFVSGPCIGGMLRSEVPAEYVVKAHGIEVAFNLTDELAERYQDSVLDYADGTFVFIDTPSCGCGDVTHG